MASYNPLLLCLLSLLLLNACSNSGSKADPDAGPALISTNPSAASPMTYARLNTQPVSNQIPQNIRPLPNISQRSIEARRRALASLTPALQAQGLRAGDPVFMRIFKRERKLELWMQPKTSRRFQLFKTYDICNYSGNLGPKLQEGDRQSPEGFYRVTPVAMNPNSSFHLSFNLGYPNLLERAQGRTGSLLMVHGGCNSVGCYAMTDPAMEEIYTLANEALVKGQPHFEVHAFPFVPSNENLAQMVHSPWYDFWQNLVPAYDLFNQNRQPPNIRMHALTYIATPKKQDLAQR